MDTVILMAGACGLLMVIGGLGLFYKGAVSLEVASKDEAVQIEFFRRFKLTTQYPALAFFLIGLAFTGLSLLPRTPETASTLHVVGQIDAPEPAKVTLQLSRTPKWLVSVGSDGRVDQRISARVENLLLQATLVGEPQEINISVTDDGVADLGEVSIRPGRVRPAVVATIGNE